MTTYEKLRERVYGIIYPGGDRGGDRGFPKDLYDDEGKWNLRPLTLQDILSAMPNKKVAIDGEGCVWIIEEMPELLFQDIDLTKSMQDQSEEVLIKLLELVG